MEDSEINIDNDFEIQKKKQKMNIIKKKKK